MTFTEAQALWKYDSESGVIEWADGKRAPVGRIPSGGYVSIVHLGKGYKAHRLAWLLSFGEWPRDEMDHINGQRDDNRLCNLRAVSHKSNQANQKHHRTGLKKPDWRTRPEIVEAKMAAKAHYRNQKRASKELGA